MNLYHELSPIDGRVHTQNIAILSNAAASNTIFDLQRLQPTVFSVNDVYRKMEGDAINPRTTAVVDPSTGTVLVMLQGMIGFDKVAACLDGWGAAVNPVGPRVSPYEIAAYNVFTFLAANFVFANAKMFIVGHSYGGAVAMYLAQQLRQANAYTSLKVYTYGAPKAVIGQAIGREVQTATRRLFLTGDPVPRLPLSTLEVDYLWTAMGVPTAQRWSRWYQPCSGLRVEEDGTIDPANNPTARTAVRPILTLAGWMTGSDAFGSDQHSLTAYYNAFTKTPWAAAPNTAPATQPGRNTTPPVTANQARAAQGEILAAVAQGVEAAPQDAAVGVLQGTPLVAGQRFYGGLVNKRPVVLYGNNVVLFTKTRRTRRAIVRWLNRRL